MPKATTGKHLPGVIQIPSLAEVSKSPFVIKKVERAKAFIARYGLPKDDKSAKKSK